MQYLVSVIIVSLFLTVVPKIPQSAAANAGQPEIIEQPADPSPTPSAVEVTVTRPTEPVELTLKQRITDTFGKNARVAYAVMMAESHGRSIATNTNKNGSTDRGVFQINSVHIKKVNGNLESLYIDEVNVKVAKQIFDDSGWGAWSAYNNGHYKQYLSSY